MANRNCNLIVKRIEEYADDIPLKNRGCPKAIFLKINRKKPFIFMLAFSKSALFT